MVKLVSYSAVFFNLWNEFLASSKNSTFLINRCFMEYHSGRFLDLSLLIFYKNRLVALFPANNVENKIVYSHQGLTYGGIIVNGKMTTTLMLQITESLISYFSDLGFSEMVYKPIPHIYHRQASEEDLYALFRHKAELVGRNVSSTVYVGDKLDYSSLRRRCLNKARKNDLYVKECADFDVFWALLNENLQLRHGVNPVHSLSEIKYLKSRFNHNIKLFGTFEDGCLIAGCVTFETDKVVHAQYISASDRGRTVGALDLLFDFLIRKTQAESKHFDFGTSTEHGGHLLNEGLISQKEGFGARATVYDTYKLKLQ